MTFYIFLGIGYFIYLYETDKEYQILSISKKIIAFMFIIIYYPAIILVSALLATVKN